jgi:hypothetical protein
VWATVTVGKRHRGGFEYEWQGNLTPSVLTKLFFDIYVKYFGYPRIQYIAAQWREFNADLKA